MFIDRGVIDLHFFQSLQKIPVKLITYKTGIVRKR